MEVNKKDLRFGNINHVNYPNKSGDVYCRVKNKLWKLDFSVCEKCPLVSGSAQGDGVECYYYDAIFKDDVEPLINSPEDELLRVSKLIDDKIIDKTAVRK